MATPRLEVGRVGRPHGLDGSFHVRRPEEGVLAEGMRVTIGGNSYEIERFAGTAAKPIVRLQGVGSREAVEPLRGEPILVGRGDVAPLEEDEYWADDLVGLAVVDGERAVGVVGRVRALPSCEVLEVGRLPETDCETPTSPRSGGSGAQLLIPLVGDAVRSVDLEAGRIDVDLAFLDAR